MQFRPVPSVALVAEQPGNAQFSRGSAAASSSDAAVLSVARVSASPLQPLVTAATLLRQAAASLLQKTFAHLVSSASSGSSGKPLQESQEGQEGPNHPDQEHGDSAEGMQAVVEHSFGPTSSNHVKSLSALAEDLGMARSSLCRHKHSLAAAISQACSIGWTCTLRRMVAMMRSGLIKGHLLVKKRVYDETPLTLRVKTESSGESAQENKFQVAKTLQSRFSLGALCEHIPSKTFFFVHGLVVTPLQVIHRTRGADLYQAQCAVEASIPNLGDVSKAFDQTLQLTTTDRYAANEVAEQAMTQGCHQYSSHSCSNL